MIFLDSISDKRLAPYCSLKERSGSIDDACFVVEGRLVVEQLLSSHYKVQSVLVSDNLADEFHCRVGADIPVLVLPKAMISELVGYPFHRGVLACGTRKPSLDIRSIDWTTIPLALAAIGVTEKENVGSMMRSAAALGVQHFLFDAATIDPLSRRAIRVSMGAALKLNLVEFGNLQDDLIWLQKEAGVRVLATSPDSTSTSLNVFQRDSRPMLLMVGYEATGLPREIQNLASESVCIPMHLGTDSLNVAVATAIFLYQLRRPEFSSLTT